MHSIVEKVKFSYVHKEPKPSRFPWSESGKQLYRNIVSEVLAQGQGYSNLAAIIMAESPEWFTNQEKLDALNRLKNVVAQRRKRKPKKPATTRNYTLWTDADEMYIIENYHKVKGTVMLQYLTTPGIDAYRLKIKVANLRKAGLIKGYYNNWNHGTEKQEANKGQTRKGACTKNNT